MWADLLIKGYEILFNKLGSYSFTPISKFFRQSIFYELFQTSMQKICSFIKLYGELFLLVNNTEWILFKVYNADTNIVLACLLLTLNGYFEYCVIVHVTLFRLPWERVWVVNL